MQTHTHTHTHLCVSVCIHYIPSGPLLLAPYYSHILSDDVKMDVEVKENNIFCRISYLFFNIV